MEEKDLRASVEASRAFVAKASFLGSDRADAQTASNVMAGVDEAERAFSSAGALEPPYNPSVLISLYEMSNSLRQNVDAYATNIDGCGHTFKPIIDFDSSDATQRIAQAMYLERLRATPAADGTPSAQPPTDAEVEQRKNELVEQMRAERVRLEHFFEFCVDESSFIAFRRKLRQDLETLGNAYYEVLRDEQGNITEFTYVPAFTIRLTPLDDVAVDVKAHARVTEIDLQSVVKKRVFRRYLQIFERKSMTFKAFGDPRAISRRNGRVLADGESWGEGDGPATEIVHVKLHSPRSAYGVPRWIGNLLSVFGSRQAEEINHSYFENKSVPPLAVLVSGARLSEDSVARLESYIDGNIKGKRNFHKILIIEADAAPQGGDMGLANSGRMNIELKPLTDAQQKDALFQSYDERNIDKVGMSFRLPRLLRGDIRDFNRASADASLEFAEQQVFSPERQDFDWAINRRILSEMNVRFWRFESNSPTTKDPSVLTEIITKMVIANVLTPEEARELAQGVFNEEFANLDAAWTKQPVALTLAGLAVQEEDSSTPYTGEEAGPGQARDSFSAPFGVSTKEDMTTSDLPAGGLNAGGLPRKKRPMPSYAKAATELVALRNILLEIEARAAKSAFRAATEEDGRADTE